MSPIPICEVTIVDTEAGVLFAYWKEFKLGYLKAADGGDGTVLLGDVFVFPEVAMDSSWLAKMIRVLRPNWKMLYPRRAGIGTKLLQHFLRACQERGVHEVYGNVVPSGVAECPFLEAWYERLGFKTGSPDGRSEYGTIAFKVIWNPPC